MRNGRCSQKMIVTCAAPTPFGVGRASRFQVWNDDEPARLERPFRIRMPATLAVAGRAGIASLLAVCAATVDEDGHRLPSELLPEIVVELRVVTRNDEDVSERHQLLGGSGRPKANVHLTKQRQRLAEMI